MTTYKSLYREIRKTENWFMFDFELLSIVLLILGIIVSIMIAYIEYTKK